MILINRIAIVYYQDFDEEYPAKDAGIELVIFDMNGSFMSREVDA